MVHDWIEHFRSWFNAKNVNLSFLFIGNERAYRKIYKFKTLAFSKWLLNRYDGNIEHISNFWDNIQIDSIDFYEKKESHTGNKNKNERHANYF